MSVTAEQSRSWPRSPKGKLICPECGASGWRNFGKGSWINKHAEHVTCECGQVVPASTFQNHLARSSAHRTEVTP